MLVLLRSLHSLAEKKIDDRKIKEQEGYLSSSIRGFRGLFLPFPFSVPKPPIPPPSRQSHSA
ncbi:MAG: hypothetical protein WCJ35_29045, partial [Planctomycetota bacterium]